MVVLGVFILLVTFAFYHTHRKKQVP